MRRITRKDQKMTQDEFIRVLAHNADFTIQDTQHFIDALVKTVNGCVESRDGFMIQNFGVLEFGKVKERTVHSKLLGDNIFPEAEKVYFHLSNNLKKVMKNSKK
jgi:nucleoid DNA-binding protein